MKTDELITLLARQPDALPKTQPLRDTALALVAGLVAAFLLMALVLGPRTDLVEAVASCGLVAASHDMSNRKRRRLPAPRRGHRKEM